MWGVERGVWAWAQGAGAGRAAALGEEGSRAPAASEQQHARAGGAAAAPARAVAGPHAVAQTGQVEVFAGRTVARSEDALLRPQEGMPSDRYRAETGAPPGPDPDTVRRPRLLGPRDLPCQFFWIPLFVNVPFFMYEYSSYHCSMFRHVFNYTVISLCVLFSRQLNTECV